MNRNNRLVILLLTAALSAQVCSETVPVPTTVFGNFQNPVTVEKSIPGIELQLYPEKYLWYEGQAPVFKACIRNQTSELYFTYLSSVAMAVSVDGKWSTIESNMGIHPTALLPEKWIDGIRVSVWSNVLEMLKPGEHTIRIACFIYLNNSFNKEQPFILPSKPPIACIISNPVIINILPKWGSTPQHGVFFEWDFETEKEIPIVLRPEHTIPVDRVWPKTISFHPTGRSRPEMQAVLSIDGLDINNTQWKIRIELLNQYNQVLDEIESIHHISGRKQIFAGGIARRKYRIEFELGPGEYGNVNAIHKFRIYFQLTQEEQGFSHVINREGWGKVAAGLQCRITPEESFWGSEQNPIILYADIRNAGSFPFKVNTTEGNCQICFDGQWYRRFTNQTESSPFSPSTQYSQIPITLNSTWRHVEDCSKLMLAEGQHTLQVAFQGERTSVKPMPSVWFVSNPVKIKIVVN